MPTIANSAFPEGDRRAVLLARVPERLDSDQRQLKYDNPLNEMIRKAAIDASVRGFSQPHEDTAVQVGIEVFLKRFEDIEFIAECLVKLGAPLETVIEVETDKASTEVSLADVKSE